MFNTFNKSSPGFLQVVLLMKRLTFSSTVSQHSLIFVYVYGGENEVLCSAQILKPSLMKEELLSQQDVQRTAPVSLAATEGLNMSHEQENVTSASRLYF